jgi:hypothetical protein
VFAVAITTILELNAEIQDHKITIVSVQIQLEIIRELHVITQVLQEITQELQEVLEITIRYETIADLIKERLQSQREVILLELQDRTIIVLNVNQLPKILVAHKERLRIADKKDQEKEIKT